MKLGRQALKSPTHRRLVHAQKMGDLKQRTPIQKPRRQKKPVLWRQYAERSCHTLAETQEYFRRGNRSRRLGRQILISNRSLATETAMIVYVPLSQCRSQKTLEGPAP